MKSVKILKPLGYSSIAVGIIYGTISFVLLFVSEYSGLPFNFGGREIKIVSPQVIFFTLLTGGIFFADSKIIERIKKKHDDKESSAVTILIIVISVFVLAAVYFRFEIGRESGSIKILLWQGAVFFLKLIMNSYNRKTSE